MNSQSKNMLVVAFLEGGALMAVELLGAKMLAPWFGTSIYVWSSVFTCTLGGIALGYIWGGKLSSGENVAQKLQKVLLLSFALTAVLPFSSEMILGGILQSGLGSQIQMGSMIACLFTIFPVLVTFGMVSPMIIRIRTNLAEEVGQKAGQVYTISTLGGVLLTILTGYYLIPGLGVRISLLLASAMMLTAWLIARKSLNLKQSIS